MASISTNTSKRSFFGFFGSHADSNDGLEIKEGLLVFTGGSKYQSIPLESVEKISFIPRDEPWQELLIKQKEENSYSYFFHSAIDELAKAVKKINKELEPVQPICKFILSAKQGALSSRD